jgi:hypothetical protein
VASSRASTELLARPEDVWAFLDEPRHLSDWWPNIGGVEPDRRGLVAGARWRVRSRESTWLAREGTGDTLLVHVAEPPRRFVFELVRAGLRAELVLSELEPGRTQAELSASGSILRGFRRSLAGVALARLRALVQTANAL